MGIFDKLKGKKEEEIEAKAASTKKSVKKTEDKPVKVETKPAAVVSKTYDKKELKGKSQHAHLVIIKPLVTEKAAHLASIHKYVFSVNPKMNKIEVKKAIRSIYNVEPLDVNMITCSGRNVRYGRVQGRTKDWKKAIVTLKPSDKIEIYEGV